MTKSELLKKAAEGDTEAQFELGNKYYVGMRGFPKDIDKARMWWQVASEHDNSNAQLSLGILFYTGEGMSVKDKDEAFAWWKRAAKNGCKIAERYLKCPPFMYG